MSITQVNLQEEIIQNLQTLPQEQLHIVFIFVQSFQADTIFQKWDNISDEESQALQAEFAQEDIDFSENILTDYLSHLKEVEEG